MKASATSGYRPKKKTWKLLKRNWELLLFVFPAALYIFIFNYMPLYGIQLAFKEYVVFDGIWGSEWVGFEQFERFFTSIQFWDLLKNTLALSLYTLVAGFPMPIILALLLNNVPGKRLKSISQTITYAPHFISAVVLVGMMSILFSTYGGVVNHVIGLLGGPDDTLFMGDPKYFRHMYVWSGVWQTAGWSSIMYMSVLAGVDPSISEAAIVDGASKLKRIWYIDIPFILPTAVILLILECGKVMSVGFEKVFLMQNSVNITVSEVISTYVYKIGLLDMQYSYSTAIGLFNNVINFVMLVLVNRISKMVSNTSLW